MGQYGMIAYTFEFLLKYCTVYPFSMLQFIRLPSGHVLYHFDAVDFELEEDDIFLFNLQFIIIFLLFLPQVVGLTITYMQKMEFTNFQAIIEVITRSFL